MLTKAELFEAVFEAPIDRLRWLLTALVAAMRIDDLAPLSGKPSMGQLVVSLVFELVHRKVFPDSLLGLLVAAQELVASKGDQAARFSDMTDAELVEETAKATMALWLMLQPSHWFILADSCEERGHAITRALNGVSSYTAQSLALRVATLEARGVESIRRSSHGL